MDKNICLEEDSGLVPAMFSNMNLDETKKDYLQQSGLPSKENRGRFLPLSDMSEDAIITVGDDWRIRDINEMALVRYKYGREEFTGMPVRHLFKADTSGSLPQRVEMAMKYIEHGETTYVAEHMTSEEDIIPTEVITRKIHLDGAPAFLFICRDILRGPTMSGSRMQKPDFFETSLVSSATG